MQTEQYSVQAQQNGPRAPRPRLRRVLRAAGVVGLALVLLALAGKWWIIPAVARWQIETRIGEYWDGTAEFDRLDFAYFGASTLEGLRVRDRSGRTWLTVRRLAVTPCDWPGLHPRLRAVEAEGFAASVYVGDGNALPALRKLPFTEMVDWLDLHELRASGTVELVAGGKTVDRLNLAELSVRRNGQRYDVSVDMADPKLGATMSVIGVTGFRLSERGVEIGDLWAEAAGGRVHVSGSALLAPGGRLDVRGQIAARDVEMSQVRLPLHGMNSGRAKGAVQFTVGGADWRTIRGRGTAIIERMDLRTVPAASAMFARAGLSAPEALADANVDSSFRLDGWRVVLDRTQVRLRLGRVDVEQGASVNIRSGQMDLVASVRVLENVKNAVKYVPLVSTLASLTERLSRLHVRGVWSDPNSVVVTPAAVVLVEESAARPKGP